MKNLLKKSLEQITIFSLIVFFLSIPSYFLLVDWIWLKELDENNQLIAERIENEFNSQGVSGQKLIDNINFWNEIQPMSKILPASEPLLENNQYTVTRQNPYTTDIAIDRFRGLKTNIKINNQSYILTIETNVEETEETVAYIAIVTLVFFFILVVGFWIINMRLSKKLWYPFEDTLNKVKSFKLQNQDNIQFLKTDVIEFAELNHTLEKLLQHSTTTYNNQKEFTENASHELQTPLAILKNKLDLLIQDRDLTKRQYEIAEQMNRALLKSSRINKNLLLLSKIENTQFESFEQIKVSEIINQSFETLSYHFEEKKLEVKQDINSEVIVEGNYVLIETLINNLIVNAIRYSPPQGVIVVILTQSGLEIRNFGEKALQQDLLFKRFSRISADSNGSGLGLSIVKAICKLYGWKAIYHFEINQHNFGVKF